MAQLVLKHPDGLKEDKKEIFRFNNKYGGVFKELCKKLIITQWSSGWML